MKALTAADVDRLVFLSEQRLAVTRLEDRFAAAALASKAAQGLGFSASMANAAGIVACELAENVVRHGRGGAVIISQADGPQLLQIAAEDHGPPIRDLETALMDGCTDQGPINPDLMHGRGGIGSGLGAIRRLSVALVFTHGPTSKSVAALLDNHKRIPGPPCPVFMRPPQGGP